MVQYSPVDNNQTNISERYIRTWKCHFGSMRAGTSPTFPPENWCQMMEQCNITLNMLRPCTINPLLSAFEATEGHYSINATPMAPISTEMLMHHKPVRRHSWGYHTLKASYIGPSLKHYRVIKGVTNSGAVRLTDTCKFKHHSLTIPTITATDRIVKSIQDLTAAIGGRNKAPPEQTRGNRGPSGDHLWEQRLNPPTSAGASRPRGTTFPPNREMAPGRGRKPRYTARPVQRRDTPP